jgi:integrase-like protein
MEDRRAGTPPGRPRPPPGPTPSGRPNTGAPAIRRPTRADAASARVCGPEPPPRRQAPAVDPAGRQHWRSLDLGWIVALVGHAHERIGQAQGADDRRRQQHSLVARHRSARAVDQRTRCTGVPALGQRAGVREPRDPALARRGEDRDCVDRPRQATAERRYESFNGKFECLSMKWFRSRIEARVVVEIWRRLQCRWPHSSLDYHTPPEFAGITNPPTRGPSSSSRWYELPGARQPFAELACSAFKHLQWRRA